MELICNELSCFPLAKSNEEAQKRFSDFLKTFKKANKVYGFNTIRMLPDFVNQTITTNLSFVDWINSISDSHLKNSILTFFKKPFADDLLEYEESIFVENEYLINNKGAPVNKEPVGLAISYIKNVPALSFNSHSFWRKRKIELSEKNTSTGNSSNVFAYNICQTEEIEEPEIKEWFENTLLYKIESPEILTQFLSFSSYDVFYEKTFLYDLFEWKKDDFELFKFILRLMKDVEKHPFRGGIGKTENLKNKGKEASKRINAVDRLSYTLIKNKVNFISCKGHYEFH